MEIGYRGFECVVKPLRMVLYKPDGDSNDCKLPNKKLHVRWVEYHTIQATVALGWVLIVGLKNRRLILDDRQLYVLA